MNVILYVCNGYTARLDSSSTVTDDFSIYRFYCITANLRDAADNQLQYAETLI